MAEEGRKCSKSSVTQLDTYNHVMVDARQGSTVGWRFVDEIAGSHQ